MLRSMGLAVHLDIVWSILQRCKNPSKKGHMCTNMTISAKSIALTVFIITYLSVTLCCFLLI